MPCQSTEDEDVVFKPVADIAESVALAAAHRLRSAGANVQPSLTFRCNPDMASLSTPQTRRNAVSRPDSYGLFTTHEQYVEDGRTFWEYIAVPGEMKKSDTYQTVNDVSDNFDKSLPELLLTVKATE